MKGARCRGVSELLGTLGGRDEAQRCRRLFIVCKGRSMGGGGKTRGCQLFAKDVQAEGKEHRYRRTSFVENVCWRGQGAGLLSSLPPFYVL